MHFLGLNKSSATTLNGRNKNIINNVDNARVHNNIYKRPKRDGLHFGAPTTLSYVKGLHFGVPTTLSYVKGGTTAAKSLRGLSLQTLSVL